MAIHRSPNYPASGLSEAVEATRRVYEKEKRTQVPGEIVAKALGYKSLNGAARMKIASLKKYGLLEGDERGGIRVTDLAMRILFPPSAGEALEAKRQAALEPDLFKELFETKRDGSDEAIANFLISKQGFSPVGAKQAVESFRDTLSFAEMSQAGSNALNTPGTREARSMQPEFRSAFNPVDSSVQSYAFKNVGAGAPPGDLVSTWTWTLSMPRSVKADLRIVGKVTKPDVARLKRQIEALEESFDDEEAAE